MKPWEKILADLWKVATKGWRRFVTIPVFLLFVLLPALGGVLESYKKVVKVVIPYVIKPTTTLSHDEAELIKDEEWGLIVATAPSEPKAREARDEFKKAYIAAHHVNWRGQSIWENDIFVLRDPREKGRWIVAIDMFPGPSSREALQAGILEMINSEKGANVRGEPLEGWLNGAAPYRFTRAEFEKRYGRITNP
jgi:hypothetical protein